MRIPTVLTACDALAAYTAGKQTIDRSQLSRSRRKLLMLATAVHAVGNEEGAALAATAPKADVSVVANPVVTTTVSPKAMAASFMQLYQEAIEKHEQTVNSEILKTITSATQAYVKSNKDKGQTAMVISGGSGDGMKEIKKVCAHLLSRATSTTAACSPRNGKKSWHRCSSAPPTTKIVWPTCFRA